MSEPSEESKQAGAEAADKLKAHFEEWIKEEKEKGLDNILKNGDTHTWYLILFSVFLEGAIESQKITRESMRKALGGKLGKNTYDKN